MALSPVLQRLQQRRLVLASASPRRQEILSNTGLRFEVVPSKFKETLSKAAFETPFAYAVETAKQKALEVAHRIHQKDLRTPDVVIGADTIVALEGSILEKPVDKQDAYRMLSRLSGKEHSVFTGVAILSCRSSDGELQMDVSEFYEETKVTFSELSEELVWEYIHSGEPMDKAGGYGIQALGGMLVERVHGDFLNVVGFPLNRFCKALAALYPGPSDDAIPAVDAFEGLGDSDGGGREPPGGHAPLGCPSAPFGSVTLAAGPRAPRCKAGSEPEPDPDPHGAHVDAGGLLRLIDGFKASKALFTACKLHVFDVLSDSVPRTAADVASRVGASACGTRRLLDACAALGLLRKTELGYTCTAVASTYLVSEGEDSLHGHILHTDDHTWAAFTHLESAVREGAEPFQAPHGHRQKQLSHLRSLHGLSKLRAHGVITAFDLSRFRSACHVGGSTGALAWALATEYPQMRVTVVDLPEVIEHAPSFQSRGGGTAHVSFLPGDVFTDPLPEAELYILCHLPQDWPEDRVHQLLRRVVEACAPGCGLLLADAVPVERHLGTPRGLAQSLDLLVTTGEPRPSVGRRWLQECGFRDVRVASSKDAVDVILGTWAGR